MATSHGSSLKTWRIKSILLARPAIDIWRIDRIPNAKIYSLTEILTAPLIEKVRLRQLDFLCHVLRLPENGVNIKYPLFERFYSSKISLSENLQSMSHSREEETQKTANHVH